MTTLVPKFRQPYTGAVNKDFNKKLEQTINVLDFGADPTGNTDSTAAIQACLTGAGANATIRFPAGTYLLSATLQGLAGQHLVGDGVNQTILRRFGNYGDTLYFSNIGSGSVKGMWFYHGTLPGSGFTTLTDKATSGAHIHIGNGQGALIEDCWLWRMPVQVQIDQGSLIRINRVHAQGCWNVNASAAAHEGIAGIYLGSVNYCVLIEITDCYLGGSDGGPQSISFVVQDNGTQTVNFTSSNAGNLYGILTTAVEGLLIDGCYIGGNVYNNILFNPNNICSQLRITNNFFDGAGYDSPCIQFAPSVNGYYAINVIINDNTFNGQLYAYQGIGSLNSVGTQPTIACFTIDGNSFINGLGTAIFLRRAVDGVIGNNQIASYNSRNLSPGADANFAYAAVLAECTNVSVDGNIVGGAINSGLAGGYTYGGILLSNSTSNVTEKNTVHAGTGPSANIVGKQDKYVVSTSVSYTCTGVEDVVLVNTGTSGLQVFLPSLVPTGFTVTIKDNTGNLATYPLGVIGAIDGATNNVMSTNYQSRTFMWNGTQWNVIGN